MLFHLYQAKFIMDLKDPWIVASLKMHLKNRTKQRRYNLKAVNWDKVKDKTKVIRTPPEEVKHMNEADWCKLVDSWSTVSKQVCVFAHSSLTLFQFYNLDYR